MKKLLLSLVNKLNKWQVRRIMRRAGIPEPEIKRLEYNADLNQTTVVVEHPVVMNLAASLVNFFDSSGGTNFVEMQVGTPRGLFVVTVKPLNSKTPGDIVAELKERIATLEGLLELAIHDLDRWGSEWAPLSDGVEVILKNEAVVLRRALEETGPVDA